MKARSHDVSSQHLPIQSRIDSTPDLSVKLPEIKAKDVSQVNSKSLLAIKTFSESKARKREIPASIPPRKVTL